MLYWKQRVPKDKKPIHKIADAMCTEVEYDRPYKSFAFDNEFARKDGFRDSIELREWFGDPEECGDEVYDVIHWALKKPVKCTYSNCCVTKDCPTDGKHGDVTEDYSCLLFPPQFEE